MAEKKLRKPRRKWIIGGIVVLVLALVASQFLLKRGPNAEHAETAVAEVRRITQVVTASGKVQPEVEVKISPDVSGEIIALTVKEGDHVQQGDLLVRIKPDFYAAQVEQAEAGVLQAQANKAQRRANLLNAETVLRRQRELRDRDAISASDYEVAETQYEVEKAGFEAAEYAVQSAEARLREAREQLAKTVIYAPMTGTISQLNVELGERVVGTSQMAGTEMMRIAQLEQMELEVEVNENDVVNVAIGDTAHVEIDAYPDRIFQGNVTEIANSARIANAGSQEQVTNFPVKIRLMGVRDSGAPEGPPTPEEVIAEEIPLAAGLPAVLRPGMSGNVDIFTETVEQAIAVPIQAVTVRDFNAVRADSSDEDSEDSDESVEAAQSAPVTAQTEDLRKVVFLLEEGKARMVEVETGISDNTHVHVKSGVKEGDVVITGPYRLVSRDLQPGMDVATGPNGNPTPMPR
ncbi:MAG TPA: efflux RND transporter periplasmic adaptor subunit [Rhodothermales bacterium]